MIYLKKNGRNYYKYLNMTFIYIEMELNRCIDILNLNSGLGNLLSFADLE